MIRNHEDTCRLMVLSQELEDMGEQKWLSRAHYYKDSSLSEPH